MTRVPTLSVRRIQAQFVMRVEALVWEKGRAPFCDKGQRSVWGGAPCVARVTGPCVRTVGTLCEESLGSVCDEVQDSLYEKGSGSICNEGGARV